ncbi:MAG: ribonuclease III [Alphaproteobacteria bacterium]|nr:MAG: ribonuclease III [Alphaproteobacteria bacterium]
MDRKSSLAKLAEEIGYRFQDLKLFELALTHSSATPDVDNERLEFLGDRVLGLVIADKLIVHYPDAAEGGLARRLNALVRKETCADVARQVGLGGALIMDDAEARSGGREKNAILGDACEALIAAIYLDGGFEAAADFITRYWRDRIDAVEVVARDPKTALQEWAHKTHSLTPSYEVLERSGPDHAPHFRVAVRVGMLDLEVGEGPSKRKAEQAAARALLSREGAEA